MQRKKWNDGWIMTKPGENPMMAAVMGASGSAEMLTLPHDAMIHEKRTQNTKNQHQTGFYPGGCYTYTKNFHVPEEWAEKTIRFVFEGVYENARVYINSDYAGGCPNGYTEFSVCADEFLQYGQNNTITVIANNSDEENSRWYSGSGIYRDVIILEGNPVHIKENGLRIRSREIDPDVAVAEVSIALENISRKTYGTDVDITIYDREGNTAGHTQIPVTIFGNDVESIRTRIQILSPELWNCEHPYLYTCKAVVLEQGVCIDKAEEKFGLRTLALSAEKGFCLNGKETKLRGACIHHDNGVIGAATLYRAEERRVQQLKAAGFNCLRSSHHPMSRAMLEACDREGMLVLDELTDSWTRSKNNNDYARYFPDYWEQDVEAMINKDYNHPCVIMYISGNEIQEAATAKGAQLNRRITQRFHELDDSRYVTVAINGLLACMDHMGEIICDITGMTMEQMMQMQAQAAQPQSDAGVDAANGNTDLMKGPMADAFAVNHIVTDLLNEFASVTDLTSYNYLTARHEPEHELFPNRVVLGTETLPSDMVRLWKTVKNNHHVIGDMTWTGYDYIGEAGAYCFYYDGRQGFMPNWPVSLANAGDIDLIGNRRTISYFREIVFGLRKDPYIAVERVNHYGEVPCKTAWMWKDELESWTWSGYEGKRAVVNVYSDAEEVELFLNGRSLGRKACGEAEEFYASFETVYEPGILEAVNYRGGAAAERHVLKTAKDEVTVHAEADRTVLRADGADLSYIMISLCDDEGVKNLQAVKEVTVKVEGAGTLQGMGSADPETENYYDCPVWNTYDGYVLAVVRAVTEPGEIKVTVGCDGRTESELTLAVE